MFIVPEKGERNDKVEGVEVVEWFEGVGMEVNIYTFITEMQRNIWIRRYF